MKIAVLNGSPRRENTHAMVQAFCEGAESTGHEVAVYQVGRMKIAGCIACEYCHTKGNGTCIQKDDFEKILPAYQEADMIVFASPIYYCIMSAQLEAALQRMHCMGKPARATKSALLLSSNSPGVYDAAIMQMKAVMGYINMDIAGIITAHGEENKSEAKLQEVRNFAKSL